MPPGAGARMPVGEKRFRKEESRPLILMGIGALPLHQRQARGHSDTRDCIAGGAGASWRRLLTLLLAATLDMPRIFCFAAANSASVRRPFALRAASFSISSALSVGVAGECPLGQLSVDLIITGTVSFPSIS